MVRAKYSLHLALFANQMLHSDVSTCSFASLNATRSWRALDTMIFTRFIPKVSSICFPRFAASHCNSLTRSLFRASFAADCSSLLTQVFVSVS